MAVLTEQSPKKTRLRCSTGILALALATALLVGDANAQRTESLRAGVKVGRDSLSRSSHPNPSHVPTKATSGDIVSASHGALIGAGIGAGIGLVASPILNAQNSDHSEDAMTYVMLMTFGAFLGLIAGGIVGWVRG